MKKYKIQPKKTKLNFICFERTLLDNIFRFFERRTKKSLDILMGKIILTFMTIAFRCCQQDVGRTHEEIEQFTMTRSGFTSET